MNRPRNVIIITSDEMRGDVPGYAGNPDCRTPHLDAFAARAVVFERHFAAFPKCVPSRVALATGRYTHTDGIRTVNETNLLPPTDPDLLKTLRQRGYETAVFGLNHVWEDFFGDNTRGSGAAEWHSFVEPEFQHLLEREWPAPAPGPDAVTPPAVPVVYGCPGRITEPRSGFCDENRTAQAVHYLREVRDRERPFFMQLNISWPHPKYQADEPWYSMYDREVITAWPHDLPAGAPLAVTAQRRHRTDPAASEAVLREIQATYYAMCSKVDMLVGQVLDEIGAQGLWEDTVVLFCADHGDYAGQYGLHEKFDADLRDCLLHVPCILHAPGLPQGQRVTGLTEHVDVVPTILGLLDEAPDPRWVIHGEDLRPIIAGERRKPAVFADGGHEAPMRARFNRPVMKTNAQTGEEEPTTSGKQRTYAEEPDSMARCKMVRTECWKLVVREVGGDELYDLAEDPYELRNLIDAPQHAALVGELQRQLLDWCLRTDTDRPFQEEVGA